MVKTYGRFEGGAHEQAARPMVIRSVVFDIGETLLDDTREFGAWADWIGVPRHTFSALLGVVVAQGRNNAETFQYFRPGFDLETERARREEAGVGEQTARAAQLLRRLNLPVDGIATSGEWRVAKPAPQFFERVVAFAPGEPAEIAYVGDHRDDDVVAAHRAGIAPVLIRRGPWGHLWGDDPVTTATARWVIDSLAELPDLLRPHAR